jgi:hypothetical protein
VLATMLETRGLDWGVCVGRGLTRADSQRQCKLAVKRKSTVAWKSGRRWGSSGRRGTAEVVEAHSGVAWAGGSRIMAGDCELLSREEARR